MDSQGFHDTPFYFDGRLMVWHHCKGHASDTLVPFTDRGKHYRECSTAALKLREEAERSRRAEAARRLREIHRLRKEANATR